MKSLTWFCLIFLPVFVIGCRKDKSAFENKTYYVYHAPWYWTNSYKPVTVPVAIDARVPLEFCVIKPYYQKTGEKTYEPVEVKVVNVKAWRVMEERRKDMLDDMFWFFMIIAAGGFIAVLAGLVMLYKGFWLWDELLVGGGLAGPFGIVSAWYVDMLPLICTVFVVCVLAFALYIMIRRSRHTQKYTQCAEEMDIALEEVVGTVEVVKQEARGTWENIKNKIHQSPRTMELVKDVLGTLGK